MAQTFSFPNYGLFNATYYLQQNPDVATSWTGTPLQHYIQFGALEGRAPTAWFNADFYRASYTDLQSMNALQLFNHYCNNGFNEGRVPMLNFSNFNGARYLLDNPDVAAAGYTAGNAISHYVAYGEYEGRAAYATNGVVINPVVNEGDLYTLTTGVDNIDGTQFNDTFDASQDGTLQSFDSLDGMGGTDTLYATFGALSAATVTPAQLSNIEVISATATDATTLNLINGGQVTSVGNQASTAALTVSNIAAGADLSVSNTGSATTFGYATTAGTQEVNLSVDGVTGFAGITIAGVETINLTSSGNASSATLTAANANTVTIAGAADLTLATTGSVSASLWDGSDATGDLDLTIVAQTGVLAATDVTVNGGFGDDLIETTLVTQDQSIDAGAGDDLVINTAVASTDTVNGGIGQDTLSTLSAAAVALDDAVRTTFTNLEELTIEDQFAGGAFALANIGSSFNQLNLEQSSAAAAAILGADANVTGSAGTLTITLGESLAGNNSALGANLTATDTGTATTDALVVVNNQLNTTTNANVDVFAGARTLTSTGYEAVTFETGDGTTNVEQQITTLTITADSASANTSLTLSGNNSVDIVTALVSNTTGVLTVDGSGLTAQAAGVTTLDINTITLGTGGAASIIGSLGDDAIAGATGRSSTILGAAGADTLTGSTLADSIDGGTGNDSLVGAGGNDTIHGGEGNDIIETLVAGTVSVTGGEGDDRVFVGATLTAGDILDGGAGTNILEINQQIIAAYAGATNFSTLRLDANAGTQNVALFTGTTFNQVELVDGSTNYTVSGLADGTLVEVSRDLAGRTQATVLSHASDTTNNTLTIGFYNDAFIPTNAPIGAITINDTNTLNVVAGQQIAGRTTELTLNATELTQLNVSGVQNNEIHHTNFGATARTITVDAASATGTVYFDADLAIAGQNMLMTGSVTAANTLIGGAGNDVITGGAASDSLVGGSGSDAINAGTGAVTDTLTGGTGADTVTLNVDGAIDRVNFVSGDSIASSTNTLSANISAGDTITFSNGVDIVNNFLAGATNGDVLADGNGAVAPTSLINFVSANNMANGTTYFLSGAYNSLTGEFTIAANGTGADTLVIDGTVTTVAATTGAVVLVGVDSDNLVAGNFI